VVWRGANPQTFRPVNASASPLRALFTKIARLSLLDEPFSALDAMTRHTVQDLAAGLLAGRTVVLITHDPAEAIRLADVAWILTRAGIAPCILPPTMPPRAPEAAATISAQAALLKRMRLLAAQGAG